MTIEAGVVIAKNGEPIFWHNPVNRTMGSLPDSRDLWQVFWDNRENLQGFAHSHPGSGIPGPSWEDLTTFSAVELALGARLDWWITSSDQVILLRWVGPDKYTYEATLIEDPTWVKELRTNSGMKQENEHGSK